MESARGQRWVMAAVDRGKQRYPEEMRECWIVLNIKGSNFKTI